MASNGRCISISPPLGYLRIQRILSKGRDFHSEFAPGVDRYRMDYRSDLGGHKAVTAATDYCLSECTALPNSTAAFGQF